GYMVTSLEDAEYGTLNARGYAGRQSLYPGSCLDAAGMDAEVQKYGGGAAGYDLSTASNWGVPAWDPVAGDWFVLDYQAVKVGACDVMLRAHDFDEGSSVLLQTLSFTHVPSRDFHPDRVVDFKDFAALSSQWRTMSDSDPNGPITAADLNSDRRVDAQDLALFAEYWLERTDQIESADPNSPPVQP
ncbi:MAG: dockerin type I domain-containing protein, partial [Solirubrobacterales bacterium]